MRADSARLEKADIDAYRAEFERYLSQGMAALAVREAEVTAREQALMQGEITIVLPGNTVQQCQVRGLV